MIAVLQIIDALERKLEMKAKGIPVKGVKLVEKDGERPKIVNKPPRMSVSQKIRQSKSKKVRPSKRVKGSVNRP